MTDNGLTRHDKLILHAIIALKEQSAFVTIQGIAQQAEVCRRTVTNSLPRLIASGHIEVSRLAGKPYHFTVISKT
jgi:Mn-dependent DtxR family transcriptional regulator